MKKMLLKNDPQPELSVMATNTLMLRASFIRNLGLMHGKTGIAIFFCHLARKLDSQLYQDYAEELLMEVFEEMDTETGYDFENGLAGICWGMEYLVQHDFVYIEEGELLSQLNIRLFNHFLTLDSTNDPGVRSGLIGYGLYFFKRVENRKGEVDDLLTLRNKEILIHIIDQWDEMTEGNIRFFREPEQWTVTWDLPLLFYLLAGLHFQRVFFFKTEKVIRRMVKHWLEPHHFPEKHANRLLLKLAICKAKGLLGKEWETDIDRISSQLHRNISGEKIQTEIDLSDNTLGRGMAGIAWVYQQMYGHLGDISYQQEAAYWRNKSRRPWNRNAGMDTLDPGLFSGLSGALLIAHF